VTAIPAARPGTGRNGIPHTGPGHRPYVYGAPRPAWMARAIAAAEAQHGPPQPTCVCGHLLRSDDGSRGYYGTCPACGYRTRTIGPA
jgi:hypothetical protein